MKLLSDLRLVKPVDGGSDTWSALLAHVHRFLQGGGVFSWSEWVALTPEEKAAVVSQAKIMQAQDRQALAETICDILEHRLGGHIDEAKESQGLDAVAASIATRGVG